MANCPNCGYKLKITDIKAECPECGVNIPNFNWEERLEEDSVRAEAAFAKFRVKTGNMKSALFGTKLRLARFIFTFVPLAALITPLANGEWSLPFFAQPTKPISIVNLAMHLFGGFDLGGLFNLAKSGALNKSFLFLLIAVIMIAVGVVTALANFVFILLNSLKLNYKANIICCAASIITFIISAVSLSNFFTALAQTSAIFLTAKMSYGYAVAIALFTLNLTLNIIVGKALKKEKELQF